MCGVVDVWNVGVCVCSDCMKYKGKCGVVAVCNVDVCMVR